MQSDNIICHIFLFFEFSYFSSFGPAYNHVFLNAPWILQKKSILCVQIRFSQNNHNFQIFYIFHKSFLLDLVQANKSYSFLLFLRFSLTFTMAFFFFYPLISLTGHCHGELLFLLFSMTFIFLLKHFFFLLEFIFTWHFHDYLVFLFPSTCLACFWFFPFKNTHICFFLLFFVSTISPLISSCYLIIYDLFSSHRFHVSSIFFKWCVYGKLPPYYIGYSFFSSGFWISFFHYIPVIPSSEFSHGWMKS